MAFYAIDAATKRISRRSPGHRALVSLLYELADEARWEPFQFTDRELAEATGLTRHAVWAALEEMAEEGLVEVDRATPGSKMRSSIRVDCPTNRAGQNPGQKPARDSARDSARNVSRDPLESVGGGQSAGQSAGQKPARDSATRVEEARARPDSRRQTPDETREPPPNPPPGAGGSVEASERRQAWVERLAFENLAETEAAEGEQSAVEACQRFAEPEAALIDRWCEFARGESSRSLDGSRIRRRPVGVPPGLRRRDIESGLVRAARRWRTERSTGPPTATGPPADEDTPSSNVYPFHEASSG